MTTPASMRQRQPTVESVAATMTNSGPQAPSAPLDGMRVLDLTSVLMGPLATRILGDMGADVIKIEPPEGDMLRTTGGSGLSPVMMNLYRNKRSVVLDLKQPEGKAALEALIRTADVFVHNLRPQVMGRLGFTYQVVRAINPDIIYCTATGFGSDGPYSEKPAYDDLIQAASGFASASLPLTGEPAYAPAVICDKLVGQAIAYSILGGLLHRARGGGGQSIEVPMFEVAIDFNLVEGLGGGVYTPPRGPTGWPRMKTVERRPFRTADGFACILPYSSRNWFAFFDTVGRSDWKVRYADGEKRIAEIETLYAMIREEAPKRTTAEWGVFCDEADIPFMPVLTVEDIPEDPHVRAVDLMPILKHPTEGLYYAVRQPIRFGASPYRLRRHAPGLGEHTAEVLAEVGHVPRIADDSRPSS
ncbi:CaiB/BaiF CoA transferase family protein [Sphingosinicella soli]|uniref:Crotonobetainyl-CoA:carnitine CoA-transferase CaiB-like acyl-CoA transferase n=1 Tax=Sphingosinicella soli TaxID=333708 RepID=A0A7W7B231_9SPHN|nr:CoA transferase [Sphingosinicella soli]MBB4632581.1 crotonobetainyl-CoA:carnitine CoA-transferase CaiB-like acyl-CoA transferase [Sphingosinicella soli]